MSNSVSFLGQLALTQIKRPITLSSMKTFIVMYRCKLLTTDMILNERD